MHLYLTKNWMLATKLLLQNCITRVEFWHKISSIDDTNGNKLESFVVIKIDFKGDALLNYFQLLGSLKLC